MIQQHKNKNYLERCMYDNLCKLFSNFKSSFVHSPLWLGHRELLSEI